MAEKDKIMEETRSAWCLWDCSIRLDKEFAGRLEFVCNGTRLSREFQASGVEEQHVSHIQCP